MPVYVSQRDLQKFKVHAFCARGYNKGRLAGPAGADSAQTTIGVERNMKCCGKNDDSTICRSILTPKTHNMLARMPTHTHIHKPLADRALASLHFTLFAGSTAWMPKRDRTHTSGVTSHAALSNADTCYVARNITAS